MTSIRWVQGQFARLSVILAIVTVARHSVVLSLSSLRASPRRMLRAYVGAHALTFCACSPQCEVTRTHAHHRNRSEYTLPSSIHSERCLTIDEMGDVSLLVGFIKDRWLDTWPFSMWGAVWSLYRAAYDVSMSLVMIIFIDHIWIHDASSKGEEELAAARAESMWRATIVIICVACASAVNCWTETWCNPRPLAHACSSALQLAMRQSIMFWLWLVSLFFTHTHIHTHTLSLSL